MSRRKLRRHEPPAEPLAYAAACQQGIEALVSEAERKRNRAFLEAAGAGWSMREIAERVGLSASTVCRIINEAESAALR